MAKIEKSIDIAAPPEKIWSMIYWDKMPQWLDIIKKAEFTSKYKDRIGATAHVNGEAGGTKAEWDAETTEWTENKRFAWRTTAGTFTGFGFTTLTPIKNGTNVAIVMDYDLPYSFLGKLVDKLRVSKEMNKGFDRGMEKLKEIAEK